MGGVAGPEVLQGGGALPSGAVLSDQVHGLVDGDAGPEVLQGGV